MKIIDAHTHIYPSKIAERVSNSIGEFYDLPVDTVANSQTLLACGGSLGVEKYLICSVATVAKQVATINDFLHYECQKHPEFFALAAIHPFQTDFVDELDRISDFGFRGVKMHPDFQNYDIDDERVLPLYREIAKRNLTLLLHLGDNRYDYSRPQKLTNLFKKVPDIKIVAAHMGGYQRWEEALDMPKNDNLFFDTSSSLMFLSDDDFLRFVDKFGVDHFMFGTDFPIWHIKEELERFMLLPIDDNSKQKILYDNFFEIYK